jgi:hypothetical protein
VKVVTAAFGMRWQALYEEKIVWVRVFRPKSGFSAQKR